MKKYLPFLIFVALIIIAFLSIGAFYDSYTTSGGSPESKSIGLFVGYIVVVPYFFLWCLSIYTFYTVYRFFYRNGKSRVTTLVLLLLIGLGFYLLREELIGEDGVLPFYILNGINLISVFLPSNLKKLPEPSE